MEWMANPEIWVSLLTLTFLEIVLGIDNIVFISILADKLPKEQQVKARNIGLILAVATRLLLLFTLSILVKLTAPIFTIFHNEISGRDLILLIGGLFLIFKSTHEIHHKLEGEDGKVTNRIKVTFQTVIIQILILDMVFSLDSIITAVGLVKELWIMVTAIIISLVIMLLTVEMINRFINAHPTIKMLALSFLLLVGMALIADGLDFHIPKGYIYFAMAFSIFVEMLNIGASKRRKQNTEKVKLKQSYR